MVLLRNLLFGLLIFGLSGASFAADENPVRVLISGGGDWHPYAQCSGALIDAMRAKGGFLCSYTEDPLPLQYKHLKHFDVLVIYNGVYYLGDDQKQKAPTPEYIPPSITQFVQEGGGLIVVHSGMASYSDWNEYIDLIGGVWIWGTSAHDHYGTLKSDVVSDHPIVEGLPKSFEFQDEFYHTLKIQPWIKVLIESTHEKNGQTVTEPLAWVAKETDQERVAVILHGHDMGSWGAPEMQQLMTQAIEWAAKKR
ncbi:MAG: ThuA domain-containing protein [Candidatus Hinthialibacter sp.]